ncbi:MAG: hypothetical protein AB7T49_17095 [Oligoflexales bacterium]
MFGADDFKIDSVGDFFEFLPIIPFVVFIAPFLVGAYTLGFFMNLVGKLD